MIGFFFQFKSKMSPSQVVSIGEPLPNLCKNCVHFHHNPLHNIQFAKCRRAFSIDLVTGKKEFPYASVARQFDCRGEQYEERPKRWYEIILSPIAAAHGKTENKNV